MRKVWRAADDKIVVEKDPQQKMAGAIALPETQRTKVSGGTVLAYGPKARGVRVGDHVLFETARAVAVNEAGDVVSLYADYVLAIDAEKTADEPAQP